jgi:hypothetical protein
MTEQEKDYKYNGFIFGFSCGVMTLFAILMLIGLII